MANLASYRSPDIDNFPKLQDLGIEILTSGFDLIPQMELLFLTDFMDSVVVIPTALFMLLHKTPILIASRFI